MLTVNTKTAEIIYRIISDVSATAVVLFKKVNSRCQNVTNWWI